MYEEKKELAEWFNNFKQDQLKMTSGLDAVVQYGKGVPSLCDEVPNFGGVAPLYNVVQIDKELELYTLMEATNTDGVGDIIEGILTSGIMPISQNKIEANLRANINSGLVCYAQPKMSEVGELLEHNISLETTMPVNSASDILIVIAKTGSRLNISHEYVEGTENSLLGRLIVLVCEDGAMIKFKENIKKARGSVYNQYINIVGPASNITFTGILKTLNNAQFKSEYFLLGEGSNCSSDLMVVAKDNAKYDIEATAHLKSESSHASIHTACASFDASHIIYQDGITSNSETEGSVDEAKLLFVGDNSRIDSLPIKDSRVVRHVTQSHLDMADDVALQQFFGRVIDAELINEAI
jgi:Fe-S cluster assembly scaffold protein SufB